jgi:hypothetical protein
MVPHEKGPRGGALVAAQDRKDSPPERAAPRKYVGTHKTRGAASGLHTPIGLALTASGHLAYDDPGTSGPRGRPEHPEGGLYLYGNFRERPF